MVAIGDTYWIEDPLSAKPHLYFVITEPDENNRVLLVNMTDTGNISDRSCVIEPKDHKAVSKKSAIHYGDPIYARTSKIERAITETEKFQYGPRASDELIEKIQRGALSSQHLDSRYEATIKRSLI